jgi:anthranilate phosphoribosyltransferase
MRKVWLEIAAIQVLYAIFPPFCSDFDYAWAMETHALLALLVAGKHLDAREAEDLFTRLLEGALDDAQIGATLGMMAARSVEVDELCGAARVMRRHVTRVRAPEACRLIDTCGTGGGPKVFNVSTVAAIVAASAAHGEDRVCVAKHGNRGSAEVLAALGVNIDASPEVQSQCLDQAGVCFCFAIHHHPAMKYAAGPRKSLGFRTIFNLLGPLTNPAGARRQLIGVYASNLVEPMARALANLGAERAIVAHGLDGLDELSTCAPTAMAHVESGRVRFETLDAESLGLGRTTHDQLLAPTLAAAVEAATRVLGGESGPQREMTLLNAAAALFVAGAVDSLEAGLSLAADAIDSGKSRATLETLITVSHSG